MIYFALWVLAPIPPGAGGEALALEHNFTVKCQGKF